MHQIVRGVACLLLIGTSGCAGGPSTRQGGEEDAVLLVSPHERVHLRFQVEEGMSTFDVSFDGRTVVSPSPLGFVFGDGSVFGERVSVVSTEYTAGDDTYSVPHGKTSTIRNHYRQADVTLRDAAGRRLVIQFRAYDDGAAFRYVFPDRPEWRRVEIVAERSTFAVDAGAKHWGLHLNGYETSYEAEYDTGAVATIADTTLIGLPVLFQDGPTWIAITEADLTDYAGMYLAPESENTSAHHEPASRALQARLAPRRDGSGLSVLTAAPARTPWRVILVGDHPGRLVESNLVLNLNDPVAIDTAWIRPGLAIDDWMSDHTVVGEDFEGAMDDRTMKHYIDFCAEYGLEYMSIDAGWYGSDYMDATLDLTQSIPEINVPELARYAEERGVGIFLWTLGSIVERQMD